MRELIPVPVISVVAEISSSRETHASLDGLFMYAAAPGDPPEGSKPVKALEWLRRVNKESVAPLEVLGKLIEGYMDTPVGQWDKPEDKEKINKILAHCKLQYVQGGIVMSALLPAAGVPSRALEIMLKSFDYAAVNEEFSRALANTETEPREAVSAASNILESFCKLYIVDNDLEMPRKARLKATLDCGSKTSSVMSH